MDILIINPGSLNEAFRTEHLGIASLKAWLLQRGFTADTLDLCLEELSVTDAIGRIRSLNPCILGVSLIDATRDKGLKLIRQARTDGFRGRIVVGGYFATFSAYELLRDYPEIDFVVRGEGEQTLEELCHVLIRGSEIPLSEIRGLSYRDLGAVIENPARELIRDLDDLPPPDRKYTAGILERNAHIRIYASRGCWGHCSFCDISTFYRSAPGPAWRRRSVKNLVDEMQSLVEKFGQDYFIFNDDQFLSKGRSSRAYVDELAGELRRRNLRIRFELMCRADTVDKETMRVLKSAGLQRVFLGIESFNQAQLERFNKRTSVRRNIKALITLYKLKIHVITSVILADAHTTLRELLEHFYTLQRLRRRYFTGNDCRISVNKQVEIYRGSALYRDYKANGLLRTDDYMKGCFYRLRFWTNWRLKWYAVEEKTFDLL